MSWNKAFAVTALALCALGVSACDFGSFSNVSKSNSISSQSDAKAIVDAEFSKIASANPSIKPGQVSCYPKNGAFECIYTVRISDKMNGTQTLSRSVNGTCVPVKTGQINCTNSEWMSTAVKSGATKDAPEVSPKTPATPESVPGVKGTPGDLSIDCSSGLAICTLPLPGS